MVLLDRIGFRSKLIIGCFLVEAVVVFLLLASNLAIMEKSLERQFNSRIDEIKLLLNASLVAPVTARDFARMQGVLANVRDNERITYLVLKDKDGQTLASSGWPDNKKIPEMDQAFFSFANTNKKEVFHLGFPIQFADQPLAELSIGLPTTALFAARDKLIRQGGGIAFFGAFLTFVLIMVLGYMLTRRIVNLSDASNAIAAGDLNVRVPVEPHDEIGLLAENFNSMTASLKVQIKALDMAKENLQRYLNVAAVIIVALDSKGNVTLVNKKGCEILGKNKDDIIGKNWFDNFIPEKNQREVKDVFGKLINGEIEPAEYFENIVICKGGEKRLIAWYNNYLRDIDENIIGTIGSGEDITQRRETEEFLKKSHEMLEGMVRDRTRQLEKTHSQLLHAEKLSAIGQLSASIAHEFNNPLQGIMTVIKGLSKRGSFSEEDAVLVAMSIKECERMKYLIKDLQDFNRPTSGLLAPMDVHAALDSLLLLSKKDYNLRRIIVAKKYQHDLPQIKVVADQIKQVFLNLLNNAADACKGGGRIEIVTGVDESDKNIIVSIKDDGSGIKFEDLDRIFEPFFTTKPEVKGTGLGLSVSYGIIKKHGGRIDVKSMPGHGATFTVTLPIEGA